MPELNAFASVPILDPTHGVPLWNTRLKVLGDIVITVLAGEC